MIGFYRSAFLGDNVIAITALCTLRELYDCPIVVYTNTQGLQIFSKLGGFICVDTSPMDSEELLAHINHQHFECFILTQPNRWLCKLIGASNAKRIVSFATLSNLFNPRFHKVYFSRAFSPISYHKALVKLVRKVDSTRFDQADLHSKEIHYPIDECAKSRVQYALCNAMNNAEHIISMRDFAHNQAMQTLPIIALESTPIICINPFVKSTHINLPVSAHIAVAQDLAAHFPHALIVLLHYSEAPPISIQDPADNILIFSNDENLAHLIELLRLSCLVISPSTGVIHLADMLRIDTIGIYNRKDARLWMGDSMKKDHLILLETPLEQMSQEQITTATQQLLNLAITTAQSHINDTQ